MAYGVPSKNIRLFGRDPSPDLQDYLSLDRLRRENHPAPDGVAEYQGRPLLYFVDEQRLADESRAPQGNLYGEEEPGDLRTIFRQIACRGERAYLARVESGRVRVAPVSAAQREPNWTPYTPGSTAGKCLFSRLALGVTAGEDFAAGDAVFDRLFRLLKHAANKIAENEALRPDALSLVGRALFFRFLRDRGVLCNYPVQKVSPNAKDWTECFADARNAADTCRWLDATFNGDFLPLADGGSGTFFRKVGKVTSGEVFRHLSAIIKGHDPAGDLYQPLLNWKWREFDFAQIPVGLLSQVYEAFSWEWTPKEAQTTSQRYTPRNIAITLLDEVFDALPDTKQCRVLDPACGAGVFLVLAFRRLYREQWRIAGNNNRPGTAEIRRILENQLVGMDISESALRLAALSLYLTAIELDPQPQPPDKLRFRDLRGRALYNVRETDAGPDGPALGSLGPHLGRRFNAKFDVVISNPPWTSVDETLGQRMEAVCRSVIRRIDPASAITYHLPDNNPDLPFLWKATQWCRKGGRIAMALPARILLRTEATPTAARNTLFNLLRVDGIINGTNLSDTPVWPNMNQPWMLLFATNEEPHPRHNIRLVSLALDMSLNRVGQFRIDPEASRSVPIAVAAEKPWIWKSLSVGTMLDVEVIDTLKAVGGEPLDEYWSRVGGKNRSGKGYRIAEGQTFQRDCSFLRGLPDLNATDLFRFVVDASKLGTFKRRQMHRPRRSSIYDPPLVLVKQAPGEARSDGRALLAFERLAYSESFNGYSAAGHPDGELLVRYLHLFVHSDIWQYYLLATSPEFGAERRRARKSDLGNCPFIPFEAMSETQRAEISRLSSKIENGERVPSKVPWVEVDAFFARAYGLTDSDLRVIRDTLSVAMPYDTARKHACLTPSSAERSAFMATLRRLLLPFVADSGKSLAVERRVPLDPGVSPFELLTLSLDGGAPDSVDRAKDDLLEEVLGLASETGSTQILIPRPGSLLVGIYSQYRYWTPSRARLLATDIVRYHLDSITG
jgi:SAM-dependent methyltransferase